ncbi:MAG: pilus assembly protein TadG-related protein, partial [Hyphomicrobiaceae bacterium]
MRAPRLIARAFADARDGNIAIMFALVALPMFSMVGIAVDYSRAIKAQRQMQLAADAAVLAAASLEGASSAERQDRAEAIFASNVASNPNTAGSQASALAQGDTVTVTAQVSVPTTFMGVVGLEALPVNVSA